MSRFAVVAVVAAIAVGVGVAAQQEMLSRPGPGSGVTGVAQRGNWEVAINNVPTVRVANAIPVRVGVPAFIKNGAFEITWANGDKENVTIVRFDNRADPRLDLPQSRPLRPDEAPDPRPEPRQDRPDPLQPADGGWVEVRSTGKTRWINLAAVRSIEER